MTVLYFAYGSNMLTKRLVKRIPSADFQGRGRLFNWHVNFSKKGMDGSGKANLIYKPGSVVWGVLYKIDDKEMHKLDNFEKGYNRVKVSVTNENGETTEAETYISNNLTENAIAFDSYKRMIIEGAVEHQLNQSYIETLQQLPSKPSD